MRPTIVSFLLILSFLCCGNTLVRAQTSQETMVPDTIIAEHMVVDSADTVHFALPTQEKHGFFAPLQGDSILVHRNYAFSHLAPVWQITIPVALTTLGVWGLTDRGWFYRQRLALRKQFIKWHTSGPIHADDYIQYSNFTGYLFFGEIPGVRHRHSFRDRLVLGATTYAIMGILVNATKYSVGSLRPDGSARNSFPSGHTATAVMGAELLRIEYGNLAGFGGYAVAATVGVLRMYNNRHWINDVLGGAAFGFASARLGLLLLPWEKRLFGWDRPKHKKTTAAERVVAQNRLGLFTTDDTAPSTTSSSYASTSPVSFSSSAPSSSLFVLPTYDAAHRAPGFSAVFTF